MTTLPIRDAKAQGYRPLTIRYHLPEEQWMLDNTIADMERDPNTRACLVGGIYSKEVWRIYNEPRMTLEDVLMRGTP